MLGPLANTFIIYNRNQKIYSARDESIKRVVHDGLSLSGGTIIGHESESLFSLNKSGHVRLITHNCDSFDKNQKI